MRLELTAMTKVSAMSACVQYSSAFISTGQLNTCISQFAATKSFHLEEAKVVEWVELTTHLVTLMAEAPPEPMRMFTVEPPPAGGAMGGIKPSCDSAEVWMTQHSTATL